MIKNSNTVLLYPFKSRMPGKNAITLASRPTVTRENTVVEILLLLNAGETTFYYIKTVHVTIYLVKYAVFFIEISFLPNYELSCQFIKYVHVLLYLVTFFYINIES